MAESNSKLSAPLQKFASDLKTMLTKTETQIREMRAREASTKGKKLEKHELCPLCGSPERDSLCPCVGKLVKNEVEGYGDGTQPMGMAEKKLSKHTMASSSAGALAPKAPAPSTPVSQVNHEMGGFQSIAGSSPAASGHLMPSPKMNVGTAGRRAGNVQAPVSGTIPNAKAEKNFGSARSPLGTGAPGHASQKNMPSQLKAGMAPVAKGEIPAVKGAPEKAAAGTKMPKKGADKTPAKQGSGGEIKKGSKLQKDAMSPAYAQKAGVSIGKAPAGAGVPGKQPVGQGGGDAHKVVGGAPKPAAKPAPKLAPAKPAAKPAAGPIKVQAAGAVNVAPKKGNANIQQLRGDLANVKAQRSTPGEVDDRLADISNMRPGGNPDSVDVDVSDFNQEAAPKAGVHPNTANARTAVGADPLTGQGGQPRGGVGFLRGLFSMFHRGAAAQAADPSLNPAPKWQQQGQKTSARFNGATPLRRAELSLSEMEEDHKEFVKKGLKVKKEEMPAPTEGLSSINHNRRMLSVKPGSPRRNKR